MTENQTAEPLQIWAEGSPEEQPAPAPKERGRAPRPQRGPWRTALGYGGLVLGCVGLAAVVFLLAAPPVDILRDRLIEQVKARTGRDLAVAGPVSLSVFPRLAVSLNDVSLSAPEGREGAPTLLVPSLDVELRPWPLLALRVAVQRLTLHRPTIELSVDAQGQRSWEPPRLRPSQPGSAGPDVAASDQAAAATPVQPPATAGSTAALARLGSLRLTNATVRYRDERAGSQHEVKGLDLAATADEATGRLEINGALAWHGAPLTFTATVSPLRALIDDQPGELQLKVAGAPLEITYEGRLAPSADVFLDGKATIKAPSVRALRFGKAAPEGADGGAVAVSMHVAASKGQVTVSQLDGTVGEGTLAGSLSIDTTQGRPSVGGNLTVSELDFGSLLLSPASQEPAREGRAAAPAQTAAAPPAAPSASTRPRGKSGWSDEPIDLPVLRAVDASLALSVGRIVYKELKTGQGRLSVALKDGVAKVALDDIELYAGRGRGELTLDGRGEVLGTGANLSLTGVTVSPLLADGLGFRWLDGGRGNIGLAIAGQGLSERQIVSTLNGKVELAVANGAVVGVDVGKIVRNLQQGRLPNLSPAPEDRTPFSELSGTFDIANGAAKNQDLKLVSAHVQLAGEGTVNLGPRQIDFTVNAKIVGGPPPQGAVVNIGSVEIPIGIEGPWDKPAFKIRGQERMTGAIRQIGKNLRSQEVQEAIKSLLRGDPEPTARPRELLEKLLKKD